MFNKTKRVIAAVLSAAMMLTAGLSVSAADSPVSGPAAVDNANSVVKTVTVENNSATVTSLKTGKKSFTVPATVLVKGKKVTVDAIGANAFKGAKKATKVHLKKQIKTLNKYSFKGAKKLKTICYHGTKALKIKKGAFKGLKTRNMIFKVNKKMSIKQYRKLKSALKKAGFKGYIVRKRKHRV